MEAGGAEGQPGPRHGGEGAEGGDIKWQMGDRRFRDKSGERVLH